MISPQMARIVPLAIGSRISTLSNQRGSSIASQSCGASSRDTTRLLYAITAGVR
jgi:hypothetical protein